MEKIKIYTKYNIPEDLGTVSEEESLTDQSYREMTDIYYHMLDKTPAMLAATGQLGNYGEAFGLSFTDFQDLKAGIERKWLHLTPETKKQFGDPQTFLSYCSDPNNYGIYEGQYMLKADIEKTIQTLEMEELREYKAQKKKKKEEIVE